jgi:hypothetical protein
MITEAVTIGAILAGSAAANFLFAKSKFPVAWFEDRRRRSHNGKTQAELVRLTFFLFKKIKIDLVSRTMLDAARPHNRSFEKIAR